MAGTARALGCRISCSLILIMLSMTPGCTHTSGTRNREHETAIEEQADISPKKEEYEDAPPYKEGESIGHQENRLYRAYLDGSDEKLENFFEAWVATSSPLPPSVFPKLPEAVQHGYSIFEDFYQPKNLGRIGDPEWGVDQFQHANYFITQGSLLILVFETIPDTTTADPGDPMLLNVDLASNRPLYTLEVRDFRPRIQGSIKPLYLNPFYERLLTEFLGTEEVPCGYGNIMSPSRAVGESERRQDFLNRRVQIYHGHWGGWRLITDPTVEAIFFDSGFSKAALHFTLVYQGGVAEYVRRDGAWVLVSSRLTWIT